MSLIVYPETPLLCNPELTGQVLGFIEILGSNLYSEFSPLIFVVICGGLSCYATYTVFKLTIFLSQSPKNWDDKFAPQCPVFNNYVKYESIHPTASAQACRNMEDYENYTLESLKGLMFKMKQNTFS